LVLSLQSFPECLSIFVTKAELYIVACFAKRVFKQFVNIMSVVSLANNGVCLGRVAPPGNIQERGSGDELEFAAVANGCTTNFVGLGEDMGFRVVA
jgi:hypothetical protein